MPKFFSPFHLFLFLSILLSTTFVSAQQGELEELIEYSATQYAQQEYDAFTISNSIIDYDNTRQFVSSATILDVNQQMIQSIVQNKPAYISLKIPQKDGSFITLDLVEKSPLNEDFILVQNTNPDQKIIYNPGAYYRGVIHGDPSSVAAISFFDNDIIGVVSNEHQGNMVLGKVDAEANASESTSDKMIFYHEADMLKKNPFECHNDLLPESDIYSDIEQFSSSSYAESCKTVSVYIEADNLLYRDKSSSKNSTTNYVTGLFNAVATLYENEKITIDLKKLYIWTSNDPYSKTSAPQALNAFGARNKDTFDGDIGHLFSRSRNNLGGLAWVDVLCKRFNSGSNFGRFAFSNIGTSFTKYPTYSWTTMVVTHEMGHNLGSPHTHRCSWGPNNNQALDNCVQTEGGCAPGPTPAGGGTIMSYCHLTSRGINFRKGFGPEPGDLIRSRVKNAGCLGGSFQTQITPNTDQVVYYGDSLKINVTPTGSQYTYQWFKDDAAINGETQKNIFVKSHGDYFAEVTTNCSVKSEVIAITNKEFIASIHYPLVPGGRDSLGYNVTDTVDSQESMTITLDLPDDILSNLSSNALTHFVRLTSEMTGGFPTELLLLELGVKGPAASGIDLPNYNPSKDENKFRKNKTYTINLGEIDPSGKWTFTVNNTNTADREKPIILDLKLELVWIDKGHGSLENIIVCEVQDLILDPNLPNSNYKWSTGATTETISIDSPGAYSVTVTNGSLVSEDEIIVSETVKNFDLAETICSDEFYNFDEQSLTESGQYVATFNSSLGCDSIVTLELTVLDENLTLLDSSICYGDLFEGNKYFSDEIVDIELTAINGCDSIIRTNLTVHSEILIDYSIDTACQNIGSSIAISSSNGEEYSYQWGDGFTGTEKENLKEVEVQILVKNDQNCLSLFKIDIPYYDSIQIESTVEDVICFKQDNGIIAFDVKSGTAPFEYLWNDGSTIDSRVDLSPNHYSVDISDLNNCKWHGEFDINTPDELNAKFNVNIVSAPSSKNGEIEILPEGGVSPYTYLWEDGNTWRWRKNLAPGTYKIIVKDANECIKEYNIEILITAINNIPDLSLFELFPNPVTDNVTVHISLDNFQDYSLSIVTSNGVILQSKSYVHNNILKEKWNLNELTNGVYFVKLETSNGTSVKKLIINK